VRVGGTAIGEQDGMELLHGVALQACGVKLSEQSGLCHEDVQPRNRSSACPTITAPAAPLLRVLPVPMRHAPGADGVAGRPLRPAEPVGEARGSAARRGREARRTNAPGPPPQNLACQEPAHIRRASRTR